MTPTTPTDKRKKEKITIGVYFVWNVEEVKEFWEKYGWTLTNVRPPKWYERLLANDCYLEFER